MNGKHFPEEGSNRQLEEIYECGWDRLVKKNPHIRQFMKDHCKNIESR